MIQKKTVGDVLRAAIEDTQAEAGVRLHDLVYVIMSMHLHQWLDLNRRWDLFEGVFDMVINLEKKSTVPASGLPENLNAGHLIHNVVNVLVDVARKRRYSREELIRDLMELPVEENIYSNLVLVRKYLLFSVLVGEYFYYVAPDDEVGFLRKTPVSELGGTWEPEQGECIFPNVSDVFYIKEKECLSIALLAVNTFIRYYPATEEMEVVYHKALIGMDDAGREICLEQPREIIEKDDMELDYYWIYGKGRIGLFEIKDGKVLAKTDFVSEGILNVETCLISCVTEAVPMDIGEVFYDLVRDTYIIRWPLREDLRYMYEVEEAFQLSGKESTILFQDEKENWREIKEVDEEWPD